MYLHKEYHRVGDLELKCAISFNKERTNWATSQPKKIGYQVTVLPVKRTPAGNGLMLEETSAFSGFNDCLLEVDRQSSKRLTQAIDVLHNRLEEYTNQFK